MVIWSYSEKNRKKPSCYKNHILEEKKYPTGNNIKTNLSERSSVRVSITQRWLLVCLQKHFLGDVCQNYISLLDMQYITKFVDKNGK